MLDLLLQRSTVITLAIIGGTLSLAVSWLSTREALPAPVLKFLNKTAYVFMAVSMFLFVAVGLTRLQGG